MNDPKFTEASRRIISSLCVERGSEGWAEGWIDHALEPLETEMMALRAACIAVSAAFDQLPNDCHEPNCQKCLAVAMARGVIKQFAP